VQPFQRTYDISGGIDRKTCVRLKPVVVCCILPDLQVAILETVSCLTAIKDWLAKSRPSIKGIDAAIENFLQGNAAKHPLHHGAVHLYEKFLGTGYVLFDHVLRRERIVDPRLHRQTDQCRDFRPYETFRGIQILHVLDCHFILIANDGIPEAEKGDGVYIAG